MKKVLSFAFVIIMTAVLFVSCGNPNSDKTEETTAPEPITNLSEPDMAKWRYNEEFDIYYQSGIGYCEKPADEQYEQLAVFVPGAYLDASDNGDGIYTCKVSENSEINGYSAKSAPILMPIETPGYASAKAVTDEILTTRKSIFEQLCDYTSQGFVLVLSGCRGISEGAPAGVTDLKAAIRYIRYADDVLAGDAESIFVYGMSGGGAQAAILGASGDSELYDPYLEAIGAVQGVSDAVKGAMAWCPVTNLDTANAEYEWMMGCTRTGRSAEEQTMSDKLAQAFAKYVNSAGFIDENGKELSLTESAEGVCQAGSYYDCVKGVIEQSLNNYLADLSDPKAAQTYVDDMNKDKKWINYDKSSNTATITSIAAFAKACKPARDLFPAFDQPEGQNFLFGYGDGKRAHFDRILCDVLTDMDSKYADDYKEDLAKKDALGCTVEQRVNMYSPLYFLMESRGGYGTANVAKHWRIRSGIEQDTNSVTTEINLTLALNHYDGVESVDFETVWEQDHSAAERSGNSTENFIAWVNSCMKE